MIFQKIVFFIFKYLISTSCSMATCPSSECACDGTDAALSGAPQSQTIQANPKRKRFVGKGRTEAEGTSAEDDGSVVLVTPSKVAC